MFINSYDIEPLSLGASILGSGGGGDTKYLKSYISYVLEKYGSIKVLNLSDLDKNDLVMPLGYVGAPAVSQEKPPSIDEFNCILDLVEKHYGRKVTALSIGEIGGANLFTPFPLAAERELPIVDADIVGRAFPEITMNACHLNGAKLSSTFVTDPIQNYQVIHDSDWGKVERKVREFCTQRGSSLLASFYIMNGDQAKECYIPNTLSLALSLGKKVLRSNNNLRFIKEFEFISEGTIDTLKQKVSGGFLIGELELISKDKSTYQIYMQNEYLQVNKDKQRILQAPDIFVLQHERTKEILSVDQLKVGMPILLYKMKGPDIWNTKKGKELIEPLLQGEKK